MAGYVYILTNRAFRENLLKIGWTGKTPKKRAWELYKQGRTPVPGPFDVAHQRMVPHAEAAERRIHRVLESYRWNQNREFFCLPLADAKRVMDRIADEQCPAAAPQPSAAYEISRLSVRTPWGSLSRLRVQAGGMQARGSTWQLLLAFGVAAFIVFGSLFMLFAANRPSNVSQTKPSSRTKMIQEQDDKLRSAGIAPNPPRQTTTGIPSVRTQVRPPAPEPTLAEVVEKQEQVVGSMAQEGAERNKGKTHQPPSASEPAKSLPVQRAAPSLSLPPDVDPELYAKWKSSGGSKRMDYRTWASNWARTGESTLKK